MIFLPHSVLVSDIFLNCLLKEIKVHGKPKVENTWNQSYHSLKTGIDKELTRDFKILQISGEKKSAHAVIQGQWRNMESLVRVNAYLYHSLTVPVWFFFLLLIILLKGKIFF